MALKALNKELKNLWDETDEAIPLFTGDMVPRHHLGSLGKTHNLADGTFDLEEPLGLWNIGSQFERGGGWMPRIPGSDMSRIFARSRGEEVMTIGEMRAFHALGQEVRPRRRKEVLTVNTGTFPHWPYRHEFRDTSV